MSEDSTSGSPELKPNSSSSHTLIDYKYQPLPTSPATIRLFKILPPSSPALEEPVVCEIHHFDLDTAASMEYCALSYAWGEPEFDEAISINGHRLRVTSHLCKALQRLRSYDLKWIWVDAICIDQSNVPERSTQVSFMGRIFSSARSTFVYLGEANEEEAKAVGMIMHLAALGILLPGSKSDEKRPQDTEKLRSRLIDRQDAGHGRFHVKALRRNGIVQLRKAVSDLYTARSKDERFRLLPEVHLPNMCESSWVALSELYRRPWFGRGWILQEAVLSQQAIVILGGHQFDFEDLEASQVFLLRSRIYYHLPLRLSNVSLKPLAIEAIRRGSLDLNLVNILRVLDGSETTDPRDKIYCLLGIAVDVGGAPKPDYSQTVEVVYRDYAVHMITNCEGLNLIRHSGIAQGASRANATWVPRWNCWSAVLSVDLTPKGSVLFQACSSLKAHYAFEEDFSLLRVRGMRFDAVGRFCSQTLFTEFHQDWISWERSVSSIVQESPRFSMESYAKALVMDGNGHGIQASLELAANPDITFADLYKSLFVTKTVMNINEFDYGTIIRDTAGYDRFVLTSRGYFGWVPEEAEPGDTICIVFGVRTPLVLREVEGGKHILIGEAYIDGIMGGEAVHGEDLVFEDFTLA